MGKNEEGKDSALLNAGLAGISGDTVSRYGSAVKEHLVAYTGIDNETGNVLTRGLKTIFNYIRPSAEDPNYERLTKAQAGFAAEVKQVARQRSAEAISGMEPVTMRTDDIPGHVNDQLFDITSMVDSKGDPIPGASAQMKFVGSSPKAAVEKMMTRDYQKYIDNNVKMVVPCDYFEDMKSELEERVCSLKEQIKFLERSGKNEALSYKKLELHKCEILSKNLEKSNTSNLEAIEARNNPVMSTVKDVVKIAHGAGVEQAKMGAAFGGSISIVKNLIDLYQGKKSNSEAAISVVGDTAGAAAVSYAAAFGGASLKGTMQNSASTAMRNISKTNLPSYIAVSAVECSKTLYSYYNGKIDGVGCIEQLGEKGYGMISSALYAGIGQTLIPIPIVGALAGSMLGYALSSASYRILKDSMNNAKLALEDRIRVECQCAEAVAMLRKYRHELETIINQNISEKKLFFKETFDKINESFSLGDVEGCVSAINSITEITGKKSLYKNFNEFEKIMNSDDIIKI